VIVFFAGMLSLSSIIMGNLAFRAGLGVKRWALLGLLLGPVGYPLFSTHKRFAMKRAQGKDSVEISL
jgi:hypothetical protein